MDPLSIAASIAGLVGLSCEISYIVQEYCSSAKNASKEIKKIQNELEALSDVLKRLEYMLRNDREMKAVSAFSSSSVLITALQACHEQIREISAKLKSSKHGADCRIWERLKWPFSEKDVKKMLDAIRRFTLTFQFSLTVDGCNLLSKTADLVSASLGVQLDTSKKVYEMTKDISAMSISAKEASRLADQISQMLHLISSFSETAQKIESLSINVKALALDSQDEKEARILDWLFPSPLSQKHHDIRARRIPNTGQWLLKCGEFQKWLNNTESRSILWCAGNPGVGKSILTSIVVDFLIDRFKVHDVAIAHFYFDYQEQELQTPAYFMASLLKQLVLQKSRFPFLVIELYEQLKRERTHAIAAELLETLQKLGATFDRCFLVIDALDECDGKKHRREVLQILENLKQAHFKIFVTSRPHPHDILRLLGKETRIHVEADEADLKIFCSSMINSNDNLCELVDEALREDIISTIVKNAQGMFLLPFLQMQEILDQMTKSEIRKCLRKLSANLDRVFENTIARIKREPQNRQRVAMQTLMWIRFAFRPLHVDELRHALAIQLGDSEFDPDNLLPIRSIIESCSGLVVLDDQSSTIRLVHYTLQEYLISNQEKLFPDGDDHITNMCLTYLCLNSILDIPNLDISGIQTTLRQFPFLEYALSHWGNHAKKATTSKRSDSSSGRELELKYLTNNLKITCACQVLDFTSSLSAQGRNHYQTYRHESGLHVAASFGLESLVIELLDKKIDVNSRDSDMNTALHKAVLKSHYLTTRKLIEEGVDIDAQNVERNTALYVAVSRSDYPLAELLLENKADPNILCDFGWTTIHKAADVGDSSLVELLINNHANIFVKTKRELIALHQAARRGHTDVVRLLLDRGSLVNATTCDGWTPLDASSSSGKLEVVRLLLERGADINASCNIKRTPLHRACRSGHTQTVEHLVLKGADVLAKDSKDQLPIHRAAKGGNKKTIKILLSRNPCQQLSATCPCGITARGEAFAAGQWKTARVLRQQELYWLGASLEKRDDLSVAIEEYSVKKVEKLLDQGFDINRKDADGLTPLHQALQMSTPDIALSILQYGADIEAETVDGWRPIHSAARRGSEDLVRLCLEYNADSLARTGDGQTALHKVCESTNLNAARLLLENEVDIEAADKWGYRPLHTAATTGRQDTVKLLLEYGADLGAKVLDGRSVQACAAKGGHHDLADYIYQCQKLPLAHFDCDRSTNLREH